MAFFDTTWYINYGDGSTTGYYAVPVWPGVAQSVTAGTWCRPSVAPAVGSERLWVCIIAGTTSGADPFSTVTRGFKQTDNTVTWQECTGMAGPCGDLTNAPAWVASRVLTLGECYYDSVSGSLQICSTAGTSKTAPAPSFSATAGTTTADNTATWTSLGPTSNYTTAFKYPHARIANSFTATWGAAGNTFYISNNHAETQASAITLTLPGTIASPVNVYCVTDTAAPPTTLNTTATVTTTGNNAIAINGTSNSAVAYIYGITFNAGSGASGSTSISMGNNQNDLYFESCAFNIKSTVAAGTIVFVNSAGSTTPGTIIIYKNCTFSFAAATQSFQQATQNVASNINFIGGSIASTGTVPTSLIIPGVSFGNCGFQRYIFRDVDLSNITGNLISANGGTTPVFGEFTFENCKLGSGVSSVLGAGGSNKAPTSLIIKIHNSDSSSTNYRYLYQDIYLGTIKSETTIVRTGGATDGTTPLSWNITTNSTASYPLYFLKSEEITQWSDLTSGSHTATIYLTTNTTLTNQDFWFELKTLSTSGFPLGIVGTSRGALLSSAIALTSDSSTWGGAITNKYSVSVSYTAVNKGPVKATLYLTKPSVTVYVDPLMVIV